MRRFIQERGLITGVWGYLPKTSGMALRLIPLKWSPALTSPVGIDCWMGHTDGAPWDSPGKDFRKIGPCSDIAYLPFVENASIGKFDKW